MNTGGKGYRNRMISLIVLVGLARPVAGWPAEIKFETHRIGRFRGEACGVADFNNDGRLDIIAGSFWYEAPDWKPRQFRFLEGMLDPQGNSHTVDNNGKGYYDDFTNIPLDIDKDGLTDVVTCSWFSKRFDWYRNTGSTSMTWPMIISDEGVNFESGDLCDIDGDGKELEILPHCQDTRWYEIGSMNLVVHPVSSRELNYGGGVGDINGDHRPDIVRPDAWYEAPPDPRKEKWIEHPLAIGNIEQGKSEHTPQIWVYDVDGDGLNDLVTSSAHQYGIFWYRQVRNGSQITFKQNLIDKSWSQTHSVTLADLDGDGDLDFVTGKRFYAHNGADPDEEAPLGVYWYELKRGPGVEWVKHVISYDGGIGAGLDIPVVDIDADGDLDIVVTGKWGGPVYFESKSKP
jgi:hypothetical protein